VIRAKGARACVCVCVSVCVRIMDSSLTRAEKRAVLAKDAANRWTGEAVFGCLPASSSILTTTADNIYSIESWCKKKCGLDSSTFQRQFGVPAELEYL
jgi:hypothetical protein